VKTIAADDQKRVQIPDASPHQLFVYESHSDGVITLTPLQHEGEEVFPPGSLKKYVTPEGDQEMLQILKGCSLEVPE
jgi:hypothetical protein